MIRKSLNEGKKILDLFMKFPTIFVVLLKSDTSNTFKFYDQFEGEYRIYIDFFKYTEICEVFIFGPYNLSSMPVYDCTFEMIFECFPNDVKKEFIYNLDLFT
jgi:hypothetical protein